MRIAAAIGFLQMKRWGHQWMVVTCWMGVLIWCVYVLHDDVRRRALRRCRVPGHRLVALRHLLYHPVPGDPLSAPGEKAYVAGLIFTVFSMRVAAAIGFLQMKRWGHQWMIVTCWMGVVIWSAYVFNMTMFADVRYAGVVFPVIGWWPYDIFYITPFLAIPYLHTVNREIFSD
jgi:hypothetical protein